MHDYYTQNKLYTTRNVNILPSCDVDFDDNLEFDVVAGWLFSTKICTNLFITIQFIIIYLRHIYYYNIIMWYYNDAIYIFIQHKSEEALISLLT